MPTNQAYVNVMREGMATDTLEPCGVYVGTMDLSLSLGLAPPGDLRVPELQAALQQLMEKVRRHGLVAGVHARVPEDSALLSKWGFRLLTTFFDTIALKGAASLAVEQTRQAVRKK